MPLTRSLSGHELMVRWLDAMVHERQIEPLEYQLVGDIVYTAAPGIRLVVINSYDVALQLLAKRPSTTGNRNNTYLSKDL
jgi:hypothetical protein